MASDTTMMRVDKLVSEIRETLAPAREEYNAAVARDWKRLDPVATYGADPVFGFKLSSEAASTQELIVDRLKEVVTPPWTLTIATSVDQYGFVVFNVRVRPLETHRLIRV